jgi:tetratricopeptide (TPR) repeat protein
MAKPANDRYASCSQFADDLSRYLAGQPVSATHAGWSYRCAKFIGRYRVAVGLATLVVAAIIGSAVIAVVQARSAREQMRVATAEREKAEHANRFLRNMLAAPDPDKSGRDVTAAQLLDKAAAELDAVPSDDVQVTASMRVTLAETYYHLGLLEPAVMQMRIVVAELATDPRAPARDRAYASEDLGEMLAGRDDAEARTWLLRAVATDAPHSDDIRASAENSLGQIARRLGDRAAAADHYQRAIDFYASRTAADDDGFASALVSLAVLRADENNVATALGLVQQALDLVHAIRPPNDALTSRVLTRGAYVRKRAGDLIGAEAAYEEALKIETQRASLRRGGSTCTSSL